MAFKLVFKVSRILNVRLSKVVSGDWPARRFPNHAKTSKRTCRACSHVHLLSAITDITHLLNCRVSIQSSSLLDNLSLSALIAPKINLRSISFSKTGSINGRTHLLLPPHAPGQIVRSQRNTPLIHKPFPLRHFLIIATDCISLNGYDPIGPVLVHQCYPRKWSTVPQSASTTNSIQTRVIQTTKTTTTSHQSRLNSAHEVKRSRHANLRIKVRSK